MSANNPYAHFTHAGDFHSAEQDQRQAEWRAANPEPQRPMLVVGEIVDVLHIDRLYTGVLEAVHSTHGTIDDAIVVVRVTKVADPAHATVRVGDHLKAHWSAIQVKADA